MSETSPKEQPENAAEAPAPPTERSLPGMRNSSSLPGMRAPDAPEGAGPPPPRGPKSTGSSPSMKPPALNLPGLPPRPADRIDEDQERWLIQKEDKMDYGPFSLREVRAQIEKGTVHADHMILDNETGQRVRVADHTLIGQMAREWTAKHAELDRQMKDQAERARYRAGVVKMLSGIFAVLIVIGAGVGIYIVTRPKPVEVKQTGPQFTEDPLKGLSIAMAPPPPKEKKVHKVRKGPKNGSFDDSQSMDFSDSDDTLSPEQIQTTMNKEFSKLTGCLREEAARNPTVKKINLEFIVKGNGTVSSVRLNGQTSTPGASCIFAKMQSINFPECKTCSKTVAAFSFTLGK